MGRMAADGQRRLGSCNGKENAEAARCASSDSSLVECYVFSGCFSCLSVSFYLYRSALSAPSATPAAQFALWHRSRLVCGVATLKFGNTVRTVGKEIIKTNVALLHCDAGQKQRTQGIGRGGIWVWLAGRVERERRRGLRVRET